MSKIMARNTRKKIVGRREDVERQAREDQYETLQQVLHHSWKTQPYDCSEHGYVPDDWDDDVDVERGCDE